MEIVSCSLLEVQNDIQLKFKECSNKQIELAHIQSRNLFLGETKDSINATKRVWYITSTLLHVIDLCVIHSTHSKLMQRTQVIRKNNLLLN